MTRNTEAIKIISHHQYSQVDHPTSNKIRNLQVEKPTKTKTQDTSTCKVSNFALLYFPHITQMCIIRYNFIRTNLLKDIFLGNAYMYPFKGFLQVIRHKVYWDYLILSALCYSIIFTVIGTIYYVSILPIIIAWSLLMLGPIGLILAHIQWLFQTNAMTSLVCKKIVLSYLNKQTFDITLYMNGQADFLKTAKFIKVKDGLPQTLHWTSIDYWTTVTPVLLISIMKKLFLTALISSVSLIPLVGPLISNQILSHRRAYSYMQRYFDLNDMDSRTAKDFQYQQLGLFITFGMTAGILEFVPIISIFTMLSNTVGAAKWAADIIKTNKKKSPS